MILNILCFMFQQQSQQVVLTSRSNRHPSPEKSAKKKGKRVSQSSVKSLDQDSSNSSESNSPGMYYNFIIVI